MNNLTNETRINVIATIDELNQYLLGNVTLEAATNAVGAMFIELNEVEQKIYKRSTNSIR